MRMNKKIKILQVSEMLLKEIVNKNI